MRRSANWISAAALIAATASTAADVSVTKDFTGIWDQPEQESQGFVVQITGQPDGSKSGVAYWFTYDENGNQVWLVGQGPVSGNEVQLDFLRVSGPTFLEQTNPDARQVESWGSGSITFDSCDRAVVDIDPNNAVTGTGLQFSIARLSNVFATSCSGGLSDDIEPGTQMEVELQLVNTGVDPDASGEVRFEIADGAVEFEVEVEDLDEGTYDLLVNGSVEAEIQVQAKGSFTEGELELASPQEGDDGLLTFDPRGAVIEVAAAGVVLLSTEPLPGPDQPTQLLDIEITLGSTGLYPGARGEAEYERKKNKDSFEVKVKQLPEGTYTVLVDGDTVGTFEVNVDEDGDTAGKIKFRNPGTPGQPQLDFDPLNKLIEVADADGSVALSSDLPGPVDDDDDGGDDDDSDSDGDELSIKIDLNNAGVDPDASGTAQYTQEDDEMTFKVDVKRLDPGDYDLRVGADIRGLITVNNSGNGKIRFRTEAEDDDDLPLDFDPRGQTVAVEKDGTALLQASFPQ